MAFKSVTSFNEERFGNFFLLRNDGDYADVVFLYKNINEVMMCDAHYIKSSVYTGYVHCCETNCPACQKNIRVQNKLFIPVYNIEQGQIQFFDRSVRFFNQLENDVFNRFSDPSNYVFRIIRHGKSGDVNTNYDIIPVGEIQGSSMDKILADNNASFPDYYSKVCKQVTVSELQNMLNMNAANSNTSFNVNVPKYAVTPRVMNNNLSNVAPPPSFTSTTDTEDSDESTPFNISESDYDELDGPVDF